MNTVKNLIRKLYVFLAYYLKFPLVEKLPLGEARSTLNWPSAPPKFNQETIYQPKFDLMIIVPVYNSAHFIDDCIQSLLDQKTKYSYHIIFVDDGSADQSSEILDSYSHLDKVTVFHQSNSGIAGARNRGLQHIIGRYVMFVDSDDLLADNAVELLMTAAVKESADIIQGAYKEFSNDKDVDIYTHLKDDTPVAVNGFPWGKLISSEKMLNLCFPTGYAYEDTIISTLLIPNCSTICTISDIIYFYRQSPESITKKLYTRKESIDTLFLTYYCFNEASKRGYAFSLDDLLKQFRLNWIRTQNMPKNTRKAIFVIESNLLSRLFPKKGATQDKSLTEIEKLFRLRRFEAFEWLMNHWWIFYS